MNKKEELIKKFKEKHGRNPPALTPHQIGLLEEAYFWGASDLEACGHANVCKTDLYYWQEVNPEFAERKRTLKESIKLRAKRRVVESIDDGDVSSSKWWLERQAKDEFSIRTEQTGKNGEPAIKEVYIEKKETKELKDHIQKIIHAD